MILSVFGLMAGLTFCCSLAAMEYAWRTRAMVRRLDELFALHLESLHGLKPEVEK